MYTGLFHLHRLLAYLLVTSTTASMALAIGSALGGRGPRLARLGATLARKVELSMGGLLFVLGLVMWIMGPWSITAWWLWAGVGAVAGQGLIVARGIKPAVLALQEGDDTKKWVWVGWAAAHWGWIVAIFGIMQAS